MVSPIRKPLASQTETCYLKKVVIVIKVVIIETYTEFCFLVLCFQFTGRSSRVASGYNPDDEESSGSSDETNLVEDGKERQYSKQIEPGVTLIQIVIRT